MTRLSNCLALVFLVLLSACDSGGGLTGSSNALVSSWTFRETTSETFLTASEDQTIVDQDGLAPGQILFSGSQSGVLRFAMLNPSLLSARLTSYDPRGPAPTTVWSELFVSVSGRSRLLLRRPEGVVAEYQDGSDVASFTYTDGRLDVREITFGPLSGTDNVTSTAGTFAVPTLRLQSGQKARARLMTGQTEQTEFALRPTRYTFREDGTYQQEVVYQFGPQIVDGTWTTDGDLLRLDNPYSLPQTVRYDVSGGRLTISDVPTECAPANRQCLDAPERALGVREGTLIAYTVSETVAYGTSASR